MVNISADDYNILKQQYIKKYIRLELLDFQYNIVDEMSGNMTACSVSCDSTSDIRRTCSISFVVTTSTFDIKSGQKIWLDKFVRPYVGYENMRTGEIQWYNQGIYLVNNPTWNYDAATNEISMQAVDLMAKLTGLRNGNLEGIPTKIAKDENVREAIIATLELGGFTKYVCEECLTNDGTIVPVPYDIEIDVGGTVYDILSQLRDIMPNYQIYFDVDGVFHYEQIPLGYDAPVVIDDDLFNNVLISENINTDFERVKNYIEVLGHTWDVDYYSPSESTTISGSTITPTFADLTTLEDGTAVGITLPSDVEIGEPVAPVLPEGYTGLEYIQSSGTQYIDTGFKPNQDTRVVTKFDMLQTDTAWRKLWGSGSGSYNLDFALWNYGTTKLQSYYGTKTNNTALITDMLLDVDANKNIWEYSGETITFDKNNFTCAYSMYIFNVNKDNNSAYLPGIMKLYYFKIYNDDVLIRDFIPCKNPSGVIGLYDTVNSQFYQNAGTGTFIAGPEVIQPSSDFITINYNGSYNVVDINNSAVKSLSKDTEWIFQFVVETNESGVENKFWRFMGHQQAQATSYDDNPDSPFYVGNPIGSSSVGRIRIVLYGGEYDNIYSDDLAKQRADFEIYQRSRLNDSITMTTIPIPWIDANIVVSHRFGQKETASKYIVKSYSADYATGGTMTINAITWYPYYESEV